MSPDSPREGASVTIADLFSFSYYYASRAKGLVHEPDADRPQTCRRGCERCRWEARARLYARAGEAGKNLEDRP